MKVLKVTDVFVAGGLPKYTYVPRTDRGLEEHIASSRDNLCKIATVTGPTKSGKTVLVRKVFEKDSPVWVDGGGVASLEDFLEIAGDQLDAIDTREETEGSGSSSEFAARIEGEASIFVAKGRGSI